MEVTSCAPLLNVADIEASLAFWRDLLGFEVATRFESGGRLAFASLQAGEARLMLNAHGGDPAARKARPGYTDAVIYFSVASVRRLVDDLRAKGFDAPEPTREDYGVDEVLVRDPDGYEIGYTSPVGADAA